MISAATFQTTMNFKLSFLLVLLCSVFQGRHDQAIDLLKRGWQAHMSSPAYDPEQALVLCRIHHYKPGLLFLYDKKRLYMELLEVGRGVRA